MWCVFVAERRLTLARPFKGTYILDSPESKVHNLADLKPFQIVSLLTMLEFDTSEFLELIELVEYGLAWANQKDRDERIDDGNRGAVTSNLRDVVSKCEELGLAVSRNFINDARIRLSLKENFQPSYLDISTQMEAVKAVLHAELETVKFLMIPAREAHYYTDVDLFGVDVASNFSNASYDIGEAGKCLAVGRSTACVLHLMRVLELGLNSLANQFQVSFVNTNWNQIIEQVESKIRDIDKDPNKPATWREDRKFYSGAANQFRYFKDSWRNYAMHIHDKYTPEEALIVYTSVKVFMEQIAKRLKQP